MSPSVRRLLAGLLLAGAAGAALADRPGYVITPNELREVLGSYQLSNGDTLRVSRDHGRTWAEMDATGRIEIVPVGSIVFVEKNGPLRLRFTPQGFDSDVTVEGLPARRP